MNAVTQLEVDAAVVIPVPVAEAGVTVLNVTPIGQDAPGMIEQLRGWTD